MKKHTKIIIALLTIAILTIPIFRWNMIEGKYHYSIIESIFNRDIPTYELIIGNIYHSIIESDLYISLTN